jgi:transcriptional regulator with XRE-family HTH domain
MIPPEISKYGAADVPLGQSVAAPGPVILPTMSEADAAFLHRQLHESVATAIHICRIEADISQDQAAYRLNWTRNNYIARESGRRSTSVAEFILIAPALKQTPKRMLARVLLQYSRVSSGQTSSEPRALVSRRQGRMRGFVPPSGPLLREPASTTAKRKLHRFHVATAIAIRACRRQADLNQTDLGTRLGLSRSAIRALEGSARVPVSLFILIAPAVNHTPEQLMTEVLRA